MKPARIALDDPGSPAAGEDRRATAFWSWGIFAGAVVLRLVMLAGLNDAPSFQTLVLDAGSYDERAIQLLAGRPGPDLFWQPALYPYFLSVVYRLGGHSILLARIVQALIGGLTALLTFRLGRRLFGLRTGVLAGWIVAAWVPLMFYELDLVADGISAIWSVGLILLALRVRTSSDWRDHASLGACAALSILSRPTYLLFVAAGLAWLVWVGRPGRRLALLAGVLAGFAVVWLPAAGLSARLTGRFNPLPFSGGLNLYIGNNPDPCGTLNIRPGRGWEEMEREPEKSGAVYPRDRERFFYRKVFQYARAQPFDFLAGMAKKAARFLNSRELPRNEDLYLFRRYSRLMAAGLWKAGGWGFPFGALLPFAIVGLWSGRRQVPVIFLLFVATYTASVILVFISARYRLAIIPPAAILGAHGFAALARQIRTGAWRAAGAGVAGILLVAGLSCWPAMFCEEAVHYEAEETRLVGHALWKQGRFDRAERALRGSLALQADYETCEYLGRVLYDTGRPAEALSLLREAVRLNPRSGETRNNLGIMLATLGRHAEALVEFEEAGRLDPWDRKIAQNLQRARRQSASRPAGE